MEITKTCKSCGCAGKGIYCSVCGQVFFAKRLTIKGILHEIFHFFTHLDKGFPYTFKMLLFKPGQMQREYIEGARQRHQKPFSMYFISASVAAIGMYWINRTLMQYFDAGNLKEGDFFDRYWLLLQVCMFPVYAMVTYPLFRKANYNFAEICVLLLYKFSVLFILIIVINSLRLIWHNFETRYLELPLIIVYSTISNLRFFHTMPRLLVIALSIFSIALNFLIASLVQDFLVRTYS